MGHYLASPNKEKVSEEGRYENLEYAASSMQGWRINMEDAHIAQFNIAKDTHIFGVFDGHGGHEVAKFVTNHFVDELLKNASFKNAAYEKALSETFLRMDEILKTPEGRKELTAIQLGDSKGHASSEAESYAGCTAVVALIVQNTVYVANAGDSRCVLAKKNEAVPLTEDHKPDNDEERRRIEKAGGGVYEGRINGRLNLSRALGDFDYKSNHDLAHHEQLVIAVPDIRVQQLSPDDEFLVLGCDGIWECLLPKQICDFISAKVNDGKKLTASIEELLDFILAKDTQSGQGYGLDNMTCIVVKIKNLKSF